MHDQKSDVQTDKPVQTEPPVEEVVTTSSGGSKKKDEFDEELIYNYPKSTKKIKLNVNKYDFVDSDNSSKSHTTHISPHGVEFKTAKNYTPGTILKINVVIPDYWGRKQKLVDYDMINEPSEFQLLAKVIRSEKKSKRSRNKKVIAQTVNIDEIDEKLLEEYLKNG